MESGEWIRRLGRRSIIESLSNQTKEKNLRVLFFVSFNPYPINLKTFCSFYHKNQQLLTTKFIKVYQSLPKVYPKFIMALHLLASSISEQFSGKEFTGDELIQFLVKEDTVKKSKKVKKEKKEKKKIKMTIRSYFMTQEPELYKAKVLERVNENKEHNKEHEEAIESGEEDSRPDNFLKVLKVVMDELSDEHLQELQDKVDQWNQDNGFGESEDEA